MTDGKRLPELFIWGNRCLATDPIGMELAIDAGDPAIRQQLLAAQLETAANVYRAMAEGAARLSEIAGGGSGGG